MNYKCLAVLFLAIIYAGAADIPDDRIFKTIDQSFPLKQLIVQNADNESVTQDTLYLNLADILPDTEKASIRFSRIIIVLQADDAHISARLIQTDKRIKQIKAHLDSDAFNLSFECAGIRPKLLELKADTSAIQDIRIQAVSCNTALFARSIELRPDHWQKYLNDIPLDEVEMLIDCLGRLESTESVNLLVNRLQDPRVGLRALKALTAMPAGLQEYACEQIIQANLPGTGAGLAALAPGCTEWKAIELLSNHEFRSSVEIELLAMALGDLGSHAALKTYIEMLGHPTAIIRLSAARALSKIGSLDSIPALTSLLQDSRVSRAALNALGEINHPRALNGVFKAAADPNLSSDAAAILKTMDLSQHIPVLNNLVRSKHAAVRVSAAKLLGETIATETSASRAALRELIGDKDERVRAAAVAAFAYSPSNDDLLYIHDAFNDPSPEVVLAAVRAAGKAGNYKLLPFLTGLYESGSPLYAYAVREEIEAMHGVAQREPQPSLLHFRIDNSFNEPRHTGGRVLFRRGISQSVINDPIPLNREVITDEGRKVYALPGFQEPITFSLYTDETLEEERITVSPLHGIDNNIIPITSLRVAIEEEHNGRRFLAERSFLYQVPAKSSRRIWVFMDLPADTPPGSYSGKFSVGELNTFSVTVNVLPWKLAGGSSITVPVGPEPPENSLTADILKRAFPAQYRRCRLPYQEKENGMPLFPAIIPTYPDSALPVILDLAEIAHCAPPGNPGSYAFHVPVLHRRRVLNTVLFFQGFCQSNNLPEPLYTFGLDGQEDDTGRAQTIAELRKEIKSITGARTIGTRTSTIPLPQAADYIIQPETSMNLAFREQLRMDNGDILLDSSTADNPIVLRKRTGIYQWFTESGGNIILNSPRHLPEPGTDIGLVMAAEGIKDLAYIRLLESLLQRAKLTTTDAGTVRRLLDIESLLLNIKYSLTTDFESDNWQQLDIDVLRGFLLQSCLSIHLGGSY